MRSIRRMSSLLKSPFDQGYLSDETREAFFDVKKNEDFHGSDDGLRSSL